MIMIFMMIMIISYDDTDDRDVDGGNSCDYYVHDYIDHYEYVDDDYDDDDDDDQL